MNQIRSRAWRRFKSSINRDKGMVSKELFKPEKNWKLMYMRSCKLMRAKQLGIDYPIRSTRQLLDEELYDEE